MGQTRAADRRNGPGRSVAPLSSKETEDCQGRSAARSPFYPEPRRETEHELCAAPRGPKPPSPGVPLLATPLLAGHTLAFLTRAVLEEKKKAEVETEERMRRQRRLAEEHEERMLALKRRVRDDLPLTPAEHAAWKEWACRPPSSAGKRRKRKKRRKKKTPETSSSRGRARRRQRQWHTLYAGDRGVVFLHAVVPSVVVRPLMLGIMAGMHQKDRYAVTPSTGWFPWFDAPRALFPRAVVHVGMP